MSRSVLFGLCLYHEVSALCGGQVSQPTLLFARARVNIPAASSPLKPPSPIILFSALFTTPPHSAMLFVMLVVIWRACVKGNLTTAVAYYREAIRLCPEFADAHSNLGNALKVWLWLHFPPPRPPPTTCGALFSSLYFAVYTCSLGPLRTSRICRFLFPTLHNAYIFIVFVVRDWGANALSRAALDLQERGMVHDAMQCYQTAIKLRPDFAIAYGNLASCYYDCGWGGGGG